VFRSGAGTLLSVLFVIPLPARPESLDKKGKKVKEERMK